MDDAYLMNSPFTFQSMEKHSACLRADPARHERPGCGAGAVQNPIDNVRWAYTSRNYNDPFDLAAMRGQDGLPAVRQAV